MHFLRLNVDGVSGFFTAGGDNNIRMTLAIAFVVTCSLLSVRAQVIPSTNMVCTVIGEGGMACNGPGPARPIAEDRNVPRLSVIRFILRPGAALNQPSSSSDCLIIGIDGGVLLNEKAALRHVSLEKGYVTLLPKE